MKSVLKIPFLFEDSKERTITLQDPNTNITQAQVETFGNYAINEQLFSYGGYQPTEVKEAYIYNTNEIPLV